MAHITRGLMTV